MKKRESILLVVGIFLFFSFISATLEVGDSSYSIENQYAPNETIKGWINISLIDEPGDSLFTDSFNNSISLIGLLNLNLDMNYTCNPNDCQNDYLKSNPEIEKTFVLNAGEIKIIGFEFTGDDFETITTFSINISSTIGDSTSQQFYIDILNDADEEGNGIDWSPYEPSGEFYNEKDGCYEDNNIEVVDITNNKFCEKIEIPITSSVEIGAYAIDNSGENIEYSLEVCDENNECGFCDAPAYTTQRIYCSPNNFGIDERKKYDVCINTKTPSDDGKYQINSEIDSPCGYAGDEGNPRDFNIFAKPGKYKAPGEFILNMDEIQNSGTFMDLYDIEEYVTGRYGNDCSNGCIVPIAFISGQEDQTLTISNIIINYDVSGIGKEIDNVYDLTEISPKINSDFQKINLNNALFSVPGNFQNNIAYSLSLNGQEIFSGDISIQKVPKINSLNTQEAIAAYPIEFIIGAETVEYSSNITKYDWDFGDGLFSTTSENKVTHTYSSLGNFTLKVTVSDSNGLESSKDFEISVKTPRNAVNFVLESKLGNLEKINSQLQNFKVFHRNSINTILDLGATETEISSLQQRNLTAISDQDFVSIMDDLIKLDVPHSIFETGGSKSVRLYPDESKIDLDILKDISGGDSDINEEEKYINAIIAWDFENIKLEVNSKEFSVAYDDSLEFIINFFELEIKENREERSSFLVIPKLRDITFKEDYGERENPDYFYIELSGEDGKKVEFSTTEEISFSELPVFISPRIWELSISSGTTPLEKKGFSQQTIIILAVILIIFFGLVAYIILQEWYKRKYENYLFKNKNSLYNMISYIESSKRKGMKTKEIASKLKDSGWKSEQVRYVMRKYAGERTGMFELPLEKVLSLFSKNKKPQMPSGNSLPRRR